MDAHEIRHSGNDRDDLLRVREWRAEQLEQLGVSRQTAQASAAIVDWHDVDRLVACGCSPELALEIVR
jgi:hypothetical protein